MLCSSFKIYCATEGQLSEQIHCLGIRSLILCRGPLAAAADSLGRVLLFDFSNLTVLRIWKSYRHAQIAWISQHTKVQSTTSCMHCFYEERIGTIHELLSLWVNMYMHAEPYTFWWATLNDRVVRIWICWYSTHLGVPRLRYGILCITLWQRSQLANKESYWSHLRSLAALLLRQLRAC